MVTCQFCSREISHVRNLQRHYSNCKAKHDFDKQFNFEQMKQTFEKQLEEEKERNKKEKENLEDKVRSLEKEKEQLLQQIFEIARQPKTTNNNQRTMNIINQLAPYDLDPDTVRATIEEHFDKKCFMQGIDGITRMVTEELLTDKQSGKKKMLCTDLARRKVKYVVNGQIVQDVGMQKTLDLICPNLAHVNMLHSKREGPPSDEIYLANSAFIRDKSKMCSRIVIHFIDEPVGGDDE